MIAVVDCGIVINPDGAINMGQGGIINGIGNAFYGEMKFKDGVPQKNNFHQFKMTPPERRIKTINEQARRRLCIFGHHTGIIKGEPLLETYLNQFVKMNW